MWVVNMFQNEITSKSGLVITMLSEPANLFSLFVPSATIGTNTWSKHYCMYTKENKILTMIPYTQTQAGRLVGLY